MNKCRAPFADDDQIAALASCFLDHSLPEAEWTNDAHWAVAIHLLMHRPDLDLPVAMPGLIRSFNLAKGNQNTDTSGYHETITQACLTMARRAVAAAPALQAHAVVNALMASPVGKSDWWLAYWSKETMMSPQARRAWTPPDIAPLPSAGG